MTDEIIAELKRISKLLALNLTDGKTKTEQVLSLSKAGLEAGEIAELLNMKSNTVSVTIYQAKKAGAKERRGKKAK